MNRSIEVNGNDFATTCAAIEQAGNQIESWDASVGGLPAQWRINYFERVPELAPPSPSGKALTGEYCQQVNNPAALTPSIEDRLMALHERARASGKLKPNKPRTKHARHPYID